MDTSFRKFSKTTRISRSADCLVPKSVITSAVRTIQSGDDRFDYQADAINKVYGTVVGQINDCGCNDFSNWYIYQMYNVSL